MSRARKAVAYVALFHAGMGLSILIGPHSPGIPDHAVLYDLIPRTAYRVNALIAKVDGLAATVAKLVKG